MQIATRRNRAARQPAFSCRILLAVFLVPAIATLCFSQDESLTGLPSAFVDIGIGARPMALAGAYSAVVKDASAVFWNPAGLANLEGRSVFLAHTKQLGLIPYNALAFGVRLGELHGVGGGTITSGDEELHETTLMLSYGLNLSEMIRSLPVEMRAGISLRWQIADFGGNPIGDENSSIFPTEVIDEARAEQVSGTASGFGLDIGVKVRTSSEFYYGFTWKNMVNTLTWNNGSESYAEPVPSRFSFAMAYQPRPTYQMAIEFVRSPSGAHPVDMRVGVERFFMNRFQIRAGLGQALAPEAQRQYAFGLGLVNHFDNLLGLRIDYAYLIHPVANTQRFSLVMEF